MKLSLMHATLPVLFAITACGIDGANAASETKPHRHRGVIAPYTGEPPKVTLTPEQQATVNSGEPVYTQVQMGNSGRATAVFKVNASAAKIWKVISNFKMMPEWVGGELKSTKVYKEDPKNKKIFVEFNLDLGWLLGKKTYYVEHYYPTELGWGTWKLDYSRESDLDDSVGFWRVDQIAPNACIISYSVEVSVGALPDLIKDMLVKRGLKKATQWVKVQSES